MYHQYREGYIEVICGCMFAGKTEELIRRINVLSYAKQKILVFKPKIDDRYSEIEIASHSGRKVPCFAIDDPQSSGQGTAGLRHRRRGAGSRQRSAHLPDVHLPLRRPV